ncbi:MAG: hypothetical protein EHM80_15930 [Nitrospiraceae bacterium]|nr:MAG: hypothetical protein EHM80_15930 [Nitrospiraceae bacterium]
MGPGCLDGVPLSSNKTRYPYLEGRPKDLFQGSCSSAEKKLPHSKTRNQAQACIIRLVSYTGRSSEIPGNSFDDIDRLEAFNNVHEAIVKPLFLFPSPAFQRNNGLVEGVN